MSYNRQFPNENSDFWLKSPCEVKQILSLLTKKAERIALKIDDEDLYLTVILDVNHKNQVIIDASPNRHWNHKCCEKKEVWVHTFLDKVEVDFKLSGGEIKEYDGNPVLSFNLPDKIHKLQRRAFFRVKTPMIKPLICMLYSTIKNEKDEWVEKEWTTTVLNISLGGLCLQLPKELECQVGDEFKDCWMILPENNHLKFHLKVMHIMKVENRLDLVITRAGFSFKDLQGVGNVSGSQLLQKFLVKLERDRQALNT